ncbi:MAG: hypothetical protein PHS38_14545 [Bacteroidales bacterium]|nr:hypothetical protein [Bacteroidales bacterium]
MINKILKVIEEHIVLDKDLQKVIKAEYPYKETLASDIDDLFALYIVSYRREQLEAFVKQLKEDNEFTEEINFKDINKFLASNCR